MANKPRLSKGILEMKFMKRTKEKVEKEDADAEGRAMYANEITEKMIHGSNFIIEPSYVSCENLISGRLSFRGMNPEIERLMELDKAEKQGKLQETNRSTMEADVNDDEMVEYYSNVVKTMKRKYEKFGKKRKADAMSSSFSPASKTKMKFIKPKEEN